MILKPTSLCYVFGEWVLNTSSMIVHVFLYFLHAILIQQLESICMMCLRGQVAFPTVRYSDSSIFRKFDIPTVRYSESSIFRQFDIPTVRYSDSSIFQKFDIPTVRYSDSWTKNVNKPKSTKNQGKFLTVGLENIFLLLSINLKQCFWLKLLRFLPFLVNRAN